MKLKIHKTSQWSFDENYPPHEDAFISKLPKYRTHVRTCPSFEDFDKRHADREGTWLSKGINHRIEHNCVVREEPQTGNAWYIKIGSMKALEDFIKENGECVLGYENGEMTIEIYDTYRE